MEAEKLRETRNVLITDGQAPTRPSISRHCGRHFEPYCLNRDCVRGRYTPSYGQLSKLVAAERGPYERRPKKAKLQLANRRLAER